MAKSVNADELQRGGVYAVYETTGKYNARMVDEIWGNPTQVAWHEVSRLDELDWQPHDMRRGVCSATAFARWAKIRIK
jgi:hypothetical protein